MTQTVRTRPRPSEPPPTITTTQELPPPPPGRWSRRWERIRTSRLAPRVLIVLPVVVILAIGVASGLTSDGPGGVPAGTAPTTDPAVAQWEADTAPVFAAIEAARGGVEDAIAAGDDDTVVTRCREAWQQLPAWTDALVPAPAPELDAMVRAELADLNQFFGDCSLSS